MATKTRPQFGSSSVVLATLGFVLVLIAQYAESLRGTGSNWLLSWLDANGFVKEPFIDAPPDLMAPSPWLITDELGIRYLLLLGLSYAVFGMGLSVVAEKWAEPTQPLSIGFIVGAVAITLHSALVGLCVAFLGVVLVQALRTRRGA